LRSYVSFNATATTWIYTLSLHDALPILEKNGARHLGNVPNPGSLARGIDDRQIGDEFADALRQPAAVDLSREIDVGKQDIHRLRSEEHTSELQSRENLVCRLLLEKKKKK